MLTVNQTTKKHISIQTLLKIQMISYKDSHVNGFFFYQNVHFGQASVCGSHIQWIGGIFMLEGNCGKEPPRMK